MPDLKPCPFCGSEHVRFIEHDEQNYEYRTDGFIFCDGCGFSSDTYFVEDAIQKWNRRVGEEVDKMKRKRRDNRTRMQRKADGRNTITTFCLFACAVLAFCAGACKITTPKLKAQEGALKCETEAQ